ncbi:MAG: TonB-dependent receptor plug domain-containing protein, partial [Bacteroidales bacterium]
DPMGRNLRIELNSRDFEELEFHPSLGTRKKTVLKRGEHWERVSKPQTTLPSRSGFQNEEVKISGNASQVIYMQDLQGHYNTVLDILRSHATGLMVIDGQIMLRGPTSVNFSSEPMFMIDGVSTYRNSFLNTPPSELDRIEIIKGPDAAIYGIRGSNGVIQAYTRRGSQQEQRTVDYMLIGFQAPREFGLADVPRDFYRETQVPLTLYWKPDVKPDVNGNANITFEMPEPAKNIRVILQGIDTNGNIAFKEYIMSMQE